MTSSARIKLAKWRVDNNIDPGNFDLSALVSISTSIEAKMLLGSQTQCPPATPTPQL